MTVTVNIDELVEAMEDASDTLNYFVDRETGEVLLVTDTLGFIEAGYQRIEMAKSRGRYEPIPITSASDFDSDLEAFIDSLTDRALAESLEETFDAFDPRRRVESILGDHPAVASEWSTIRSARAKTRAVAWLADRQISRSPIAPTCRLHAKKRRSAWK